MRVNTVLLPVKGERLNPFTGAREAYDTGMLQECAGGKPIGQPIRAPQASSAEAAARAAGMLHGDNGYARAVLYYPDNRSVAAHYQRPGESLESTADRLADAAASGQVNVSATRVAFSSGTSGHGGY